MILLVFALVGLVIALIRGGSIAQLARVHLRLGWLALLAVGLQLLIFSGWWTGSSFADWTPILYSVSLFLLVVMVGVNWQIPGMLVIGLGLLCNALAITMNGGRMPASLEALRVAGLQSVVLKAGVLGASTNSVLLGPESRVPWLCDIFALPSWVPLATVFSVGDVLIAIGAVWFFIGVMKPKLRS
jgi:hypothetical protein